MSEKKKNIAETVRAAITPAVESAGYKVWDVLLTREGAEQVLEVLFDTVDGRPASTEDCIAITNTVDPLLDELDPIESSYCLEVSSAGLERALTRDEHLDYAIERGVSVIIRLFAPLDGKKELSGVISSYDRESITLTDSTCIQRKSVSRINTEFSEQQIKE